MSDAHDADSDGGFTILEMRVGFTADDVGEAFIESHEDAQRQIINAMVRTMLRACPGGLWAQQCRSIVDGMSEPQLAMAEPMFRELADHMQARLRELFDTQQAGMKR